MPELCRHEYLNVLTTYARHGGITQGSAAQLWRQADEILLSHLSPVDLAAALNLAITHQTSAYDAQFIALAQTLGVSCVTEDRRLQNRFPGTAVSMRASCSRC